MTTTHDYIFDKLSRIGDDKCGQSEKDIQNTHFGTYTTQNYFSQHCGMKQPISFATQQPNNNSHRPNVCLIIFLGYFLFYCFLADLVAFNARAWS